ncbi:MAG: hypothetical protein ABW019_13945 [Chitinophagaceae bacterium]
MKYHLYLFAFILACCKGPSKKSHEQGTAPALLAKNPAYETCWSGTLNGNIPVFVHYHVDSNLVIGKIIYLNTKERQPIPLIGTIEEDRHYRLLEFDSTGHISGIIDGRPGSEGFSGTWISPVTKKEFPVSLLPADTLIQSPDTRADEDQIPGSYHYRYGETGYSGELTVNRMGNTIGFSIVSVTSIENGANTAMVEKDTATMNGPGFVYTIPGSDSCTCSIRFYKAFAHISSANGYCDGQFGHNATIDGIYLKTK